MCLRIVANFVFPHFQRINKTNILNLPPRRHIFKHRILASDGSGTLTFIENEERDNVLMTGSWIMGDRGLLRLIKKKHYLQAIDYFNTLKEFGRKKITATTFNIIFKLFEELGSPWDVISNWEYLETLLEPNATNYSYLIKAYCAVGKMEEALQAFEKVISLKKVPARVYTILIETFVSNGKFDEANQLIQTALKLQINDIELYNVRIYYHHMLGQIQNAEQVYQEIQMNKVKPNRTTFTKMIRIYTDYPDCVKFQSIIDQMNAAGCNPDKIQTKYAVMDMFARTGEPQALEALSKYYKRQVWINDPHGRYYYDFILEYASNGGPINELLSSYIDSNARNGLRAEDVISASGELTTNSGILEDIYIKILSDIPSDFVPKPSLDPYGPMSHIIRNTSRHDPMIARVKDATVRSLPLISQEDGKPIELTDEEKELLSHEVPPFIIEPGEEDPFSVYKTIDNYRKSQGKTQQETTVELGIDPDAILPKEQMSRTNLRLGELQREHPEIYKRLYKLYRAEVHNEPFEDDATLEKLKTDTFMSFYGQLRALDQFSEDRPPDMDQIPEELMIQHWNNKLGPAVENKMMLTRYFQVMRAKQEKRGRPRDW